MNALVYDGGRATSPCWLPKLCCALPVDNAPLRVLQSVASGLCVHFAQVELVVLVIRDLAWREQELGTLAKVVVVEVAVE